MQQVADNVLPLAGTPGIARELRRLTSGTLDNLDRNRSIAKDALWELEMLAYVRSCGVSAELAEPPDLMMALPAAEIGVACKRMYSVKNFSKVLSEGVQQINASGHAGLIAVNLDELLPARQMLKLKDADHLGRTLIEFNHAFMKDNERRFQKYLLNERLVGALVAHSTVAQLTNDSSPFTFGRQVTLWVVSNFLRPRKR